MVRRALVLLLGALMLGVASIPASAQIFIVNPPPNISLGFDQSSLTPASQGTPLYTQGDRLWVVSDYGYQVLATLAPPSGGNPGAFATLYPGEPVALYTFKAGDPTGTWVLDLSNGTGFVGSIGLGVARVGGNSSVVFNGASVASGFLSTSYALRADGAYNLGACLLGSRAGGLQLTIPQSIGTGGVALNMTGGSYTLVVRGALLGPTEFWFELYHSYSFVGVGGNESGLFSRLVQVAASSRQVLGQNAGANLSSGTLGFVAGAREGRYTLRSYFRSDAGIQLVEAPMLLMRDGAWLSLASCVASSQPPGLAFSLKTSVQAPIAAWPREAVVMFRLGGLEDYASAAVDPGLSAVTLVGAPWNQTLTDLRATASGVGVGSSQTINGTVYVVSTVYPASVSLAISLGNRTYQNLQTALAASYSIQNLTVSVGKLVVQTTTNGAPTTGAQVKLLRQGSLLTSKTSDKGGRATFYLPAGNYTVSAGQGSSVSSSVQVVAGKEADLGLELGGPQLGTTGELLAVLGVVGLAANVLVWWRWWRNRRISGGRPAA